MVSTASERADIAPRLLHRWPSRPLLISAVRVGDGRLTWFGQHANPRHAGRGTFVDVAGSAPVAPADAIAASCAIPLLSRPVRIGKHRYVDGGIRSPTNADVLAVHDLDLAIVLSPMGHASSHFRSSPARRIAQRRLAHEVRLLRSLDVEVQVVSPDAATLKAMGWNMLERNNTAAVMRAAFLGATEQLHAATIATLRRARRSTIVAS